ncbi:copper homeostasis protein CutC [Vibrio breoganii]|uniref:copper homeostasis protein CutC n=1 Tax=Vibrio breoganii TaxID=553239 RepID=UPI00080DEB87|nr:copper homeostasis protein CutC [Vibrio breoganii]OCH75906.1 copper homeostasis protein CutC [Vibrio breoganii]PML28682.1 copper homeostasis protein CutC [Vibrio breoganii]PML35676.1 copper homeostasis protein CutC [Vibrio breoganii]
MTNQLEVCIDNIESLHTAIRAGATRIELCSSLALGGLTPSFGFMKQAKQASSIPIYAMIRPRQGDFLFSEEDLDIMLADVQAAKEANLDGIVIGVLTTDAKVNVSMCKKLIDAASGMGVTFHRAIDQCQDVEQALEDIISLGCERILTSGQKSTAQAGIETLAKLHQQAAGRIQIMAGAGVHAGNAQEILNKTGISELHLSGKTVRASKMTCIQNEAQMGASDVDDFQIPVTGFTAIQSVKSLFQ